MSNNLVFRPIISKSFLTENDNTSTDIIDTLDAQIQEFIKIAYPKIKFTESELQLKLVEFKNQKGPDYGNWIYYPWSNKAIKLLEEQEFVALRTSRNQYKITAEEQLQLSKKCVGIIGLSVGHSIALTMATERIFGHVKLADFDSLDLSNLNRLKTPLYNIGIPKTIIAAREIFEIDPYLTIEIYNEGIHADNIDAFFRNVNLDLVVEECDSLEIKILVREKAKQYQVPLIMDTSDRGLVDMERFDLDPKRPIAHGLLDGITYQEVVKLTKTEKLPITMKLAGIHDLSSRLKASMMELDETITTWPQLASAIAFGGGITCELSRKILLNKINISGRFYFDNNALVPQVSESENLKKYVVKPKELSLIHMVEMIAQKPTISAKNILTKEEINNIVDKANMAPTGGNSQPWKWIYKEGVLYLFHDKHFSSSLLDYTHFGSYLAFGAALYNIEITALSLGYIAHTTLNPEYEKGLIYTVVFESAEQIHDELCNWIPERQTNRNKGFSKPWDNSLSQKLINEVESIENCQLQIIDERETMTKLAAISASGEKWRILDVQGHHDTFVEELRWTDEEVYSTKDGLDVKTLGMSMAQVKAFEVAKDYAAIELLKQWDKGNVFEKSINDAVAQASAIGIISCNSKGLQQWIESGKALQKVWLRATQLQLAIQPISAFIFLFRAADQTDLKNHVSKKSFDELMELKAKFIELTHSDSTHFPIFMFKISYAEMPEIRSLRRNLENTLHHI